MAPMEDPMALLVAAASATRPPNPEPEPEPEPGPECEPTNPAAAAVALYDYEASFDDPELWALLEEGARTRAAAESPEEQAVDDREATTGAQVGVAAAPQDDASAASQPREGGGGGARWTAAEDEALRAAVAELGAMSWKLVAARLQSRSDVQSLHRWMILRPGLKKGAWTAEEDAGLKAAVAAATGEGEGKVDWSRIASQLPGRLGKQCRERWENHLKPDLRFGEWTAEEDALILEWRTRVGGRWAEIEQHLPGRTQNAIKNRYNSALKKRCGADAGAGGGGAADGAKEGEGKDGAPGLKRRRRKAAGGGGAKGANPAAAIAAGEEGQEGPAIRDPLLDGLAIKGVDHGDGSALLFVGHEGDGRPGHEGPMEVIDV